MKSSAYFSQPEVDKLNVFETVLLKPVSGWSNDKKCQDAIEEYGISYSELVAEMKFFPRIFKSLVSSVADIVKEVKAATFETKTMFPLALHILKLLLVVPATSATAERSFSTMKRVNTYLRATMGQERLNSLCLLSVYRERVKEVNIDTLVESFCKANLIVDLFLVEC